MEAKIARLFSLVPIAAVVASVFALSACSLGGGDLAKNTSPPTATAGQKCPSVSVDDSRKDIDRVLTGKLSSVALPGEACFIVFLSSDVAAESSTISATVGIHLAGTSDPNDLRSAATVIAKAIKQSEVGSRIARLRVSNMDGKPLMLAGPYLADDSFLDNPWNGTQTPDVEMAIWTVRQS